jgi:hypothetical protein
MKPTQKQQAKDLFFGTSKTRKEIAEELNVSEKTLYLWIKKEAWDENKKAAHAAPAIIVDNLCYMLVELQGYISERPTGLRFPNAQEADTMRKLINSITKMKEYTSVGMNMQAIVDLTNYVGADEQFCNQLQAYAETYFKARKANPRYANNFCFEAEQPIATEQELDTIMEEMAAVYSAEEIIHGHETASSTEQQNNEGAGEECHCCTNASSLNYTEEPVIYTEACAETLINKPLQVLGQLENDFPVSVKTGHAIHAATPRYKYPTFLRKKVRGPVVTTAKAYYKNYPPTAA